MGSTTDQGENVDLPFGRTNADVEDFYREADLETASGQLEEFGVDNPDARTEQFLHRLPSLVEWLGVNGRKYPWRCTQDPWEVYLAEILLQRTRADAVREIYSSVLDAFPTPAAVREEDSSTIRNTVESLGLADQRVKTLQSVAEQLADYDSVPASIEILSDPWGVGKYSARATLLFAFDDPLALVDTNSVRIFKRVFDAEFPTQPHKRESVYTLMDAIAPSQPNLCRAYNLALLDLGALICTSHTPNCRRCPLNSSCIYALSE